MNISPEFKVGDTAYTRWGETKVITEVEIDILILYLVDEDKTDNWWMEDELTSDPPENLVSIASTPKIEYDSSLGTNRESLLARSFNRKIIN